MRSLAFYNTATNPIHQQLIISFADKVGIDITQSKDRILPRIVDFPFKSF